jgi:chaperonin cofactor prefoldin
MAEQGGDSKDLLTRLADAGDQAIKRLGDVPGGTKVTDAVTGMRDRVDELQKRVRTLGKLETRVKNLEKKVAALEKSKSAGKPKPRKAPAKKAAPKTPKQSE